MCLSLIEPSLAKVGVELIDPDTPTLKCKTCGKLWNPILISGGLLPKNWWRCPINSEHTKPIKSLENTKVVILQV
jgi:hypothetical protein